MSFLLSILVFVWLGLTNQPARPEPVQLIPKMVRWPTHLDHYLCKQLHNGPGVRSYAITNLSGELCKTYCRLIDRINGKVTYTQNVSPNFVRCGPFQARCVEGQCVGLNFPGGPGGAQATGQAGGAPSFGPPATIPPPPDEAVDLMLDSAELSNSDNQQQKHNATSTAIATSSSDEKPSGEVEEENVATEPDN